MDAARYYVALLVAVFVPPAFLYWFSIHPFIGFWRRIGARKTLAIHCPALLLLAWLIFLARRPLLSVEFGTNPILVVLSILLLAASAVMRTRVSRRLTLSTLTGMPELEPDSRPSPLLTGGIYGRLRHPRYVQVMLAVAAYASFSNYLAAYVVLAAILLLVQPLVRLEERELRERYGAEYDTYAARVPRFIPRARAD